MKRASEYCLAVTLASLAVLVSLLLFSTFARAHDHNRPELNGWFMGLHNKNHVACCDGSDATSLDDPDWESRDGHYRVKLDGEWVDVPEGAVIDEPNRAGPAMVWPYYIDGKMIGVRCFMPGTMS